MDVTVQYFDGCPSWTQVVEHLEALKSQIPGLTIRLQRIDSELDACTLDFGGSPTILVDGVDQFPDGHVAGQMSCRLYATPSGLAGSPTFEQLRAALAEPAALRDHA